MSPRYRPTRQRNGITSVMAMLFMVLFAAMALGFYATVTTSVTLARNDQKGSKALLAAESGIQFVRYHLAHVAIPPNTTESSAVMQELYNDISARLTGTGNLAGMTMSLSSDKKVIAIPAETGAYIATDEIDKSGFAIVIKEQAGNIICKVSGRTGESSYARTRGVSLDFTRLPIETSLFDNAIAARGRIRMEKGTLGGVSGISPNTIANIMSAMTEAELLSTGGGAALTMTGGSVGGSLGVVSGDADISGEVPVASGLVSVSGGSVHGTSNLTTIWNDYVLDVATPEFPIIDTSSYAQYATNTYVEGMMELKNVRIPANTNPTFEGNVTIQGILYVESPNVLRFRGDTNLQGFIVWDNLGNSSVNQIDMSGNFSHSKLDPSGDWGELATITGVAILAPHTEVVMSGSTESQVHGNMIVGRFENAGANTITFDQGSLVAMDPGNAIHINTSKSLKWTSTGMSNQPSQGVLYSSYYDPVPGSYQELNQ